MNIYLIIVNQLLRKKIIVSERTDPHHFKNELIKFFRDKLYKHTHILVVQNKDQEKYFKDKLSKSRVKIIYNPLVLNIIFDQSNNNLKFLTVGRLEKEKNQVELLQIFKELNFNFTLEILGKGSLETKLKKCKAEIKRI